MILQPSSFVADSFFSSSAVPSNLNRRFDRRAKSAGERERRDRPREREASRGTDWRRQRADARKGAHDATSYEAERRTVEPKYERKRKEWR